MNREYIVRGKNLKFDGGFEIKHLTIDEIMTLEFNTYMYFINCFVLKPQDLIVPLWGKGIYYEDINHYELFSMQVKDNIDVFTYVFKIITNCDSCRVDFSDKDICSVYFKYKNTEYLMDENMFKILYDFFKEIHMVEHANKRFFKGEKTRKSILDEDYEEYLEELEDNKKSTYLSDIITYVVVSNLRDWDNIYNYPIGRLYEEYVKTSKKHDVDYKMFGIYMGTVDSSKMPSNSLNWYKT